MTLTTQGLQTLDQVRDFVEQSQPLGFEPLDRASTYDWLSQELRRFGYARLGKADNGLLKRYLARVTGLSRAQITRRNPGNPGEFRTPKICKRSPTPNRDVCRIPRRRVLSHHGSMAYPRSQLVSDEEPGFFHA